MNRIGMGYDVHRFVSGRPLILGGVEIPYSKGLEGHSDADVLSHAIADALLGAVGEADIGWHFPNTDSAFQGICSLEILKKVRFLLDQKQATICNIDATLIAEQPKILSYRDQMQVQLSQALGLSVSCIGIKATTNEGMGFVGRQEGMAAFAVALLQM